jgi:5'(3')-deoxyribonucleotidase
MIIGVDVDDVLADLLGPWIARYNAKYQDTLKREDVTAWAIEKFTKPECGHEIFKLLDPTIYDEVQPIPGALDTVNALRTLGRVVFITAGNGDAKLRWLIHHGFLKPTYNARKDYFACTDKALIRADVLIDDHVDNIESFPGRGLLVTRGHNVNVPCTRERLATFEDSVAALIPDSLHGKD